MNPDEIAGALLVAVAVAQLAVMPIYFTRQHRLQTRKKH